jgi:hypothetical protein
MRPGLVLFSQNYGSQHTAHAGRTGLALDVEFAVTRRVASAAMRTNIVGAFEFHAAQRRQQLAFAPVVKAGRLAAGAGRGRGNVVLVQQLGEQQAARPMQPGPRSHLRRFQIRAGLFSARRKHYLEEGLDFPRDCLMNRNSRFFPPRSSPSGPARPV